MLFTTTLAALAFGVSLVSAECTVEQRLASSNQVAIAYNAQGLGNSAEEFKKVPWGSPDSAGICTVTIIPDGLSCGIPVATTGAGTYDFAVATRQVFNQLNVTNLVPFDNGTVLLGVHIRIGAREFIPAPVTFQGYVYMDYNLDTCRIYGARAYAEIPDSVLTLMFPNGIPQIPNGGLYPVCSQLPVGGQKKRAEIEAASKKRSIRGSTWY